MSLYTYESICELLNDTQRSNEDLISQSVLKTDEAETTTSSSSMFQVEKENVRKFNSPDDARRYEVCTSCKQKICGVLNKIQEDWIKMKLKDFKTSNNYPLKVEPNLSKFSVKPDVNKYFLKPLYIWDPIRQFGLETICSCPNCKKQLKFKTFNPARAIEGLASNAFVSVAKYECSTKLCGGGTKPSSFHGYFDAKDIGIPMEILATCPIALFPKSGVTNELLEMVFHSISKNSTTATAASIIANNHTADYLRKSMLYIGHVKSYKARMESNSSNHNDSHVKNIRFDDFSQFSDHCGFNGTLGPSEKQLNEIFIHCVDINKPFWNRYMGGLTGFKVGADHHHNVPARIKVTDPTTNTLFSPLKGLHGLMNERRQIISLLVTKTTTTRERHDQAKNLAQRSIDRNVNLAVACFDKCCDDSEWLRREFPEVKLVLDNAHLINRYKEACNRVDDATRAVFIRRLSECIVGDSKNRRKMRPGKEIYKKITDLIQEFQGMQKELPQSQQVVGQSLLDCHNTQKKHFENCLDLPDGVPWAIVDRFGTATIVRGTNQLEAFWRWLRMIFPEKCSLNMGLSLLLSCCTNWNFQREQQFDERWAYLPISPLHLSMTQYIALHGKRSNGNDGTGILKNYFHLLPLAKDDGIDVCGLAKSFLKVSPTVTNVPQEITPLVEKIVDFSTFDSYVFDPLIYNMLDDMEELLDDDVAKLLDNCSDEQAISQTSSSSSSSNTHQNFFVTQEKNEIEVRRRKRKNQNETNMGRNNKSKRHKKRHTGVTALAGKQFGVKQSMQLYYDCFENSSENFNPVERRLLRFCIMNMNSHQEPRPTDLREVNVQTLDFGMLHNIWKVICSSLSNSTKEYKKYIRLKSETHLKEFTRSMIATVACSIPSSATTNSRLANVVTRFQQISSSAAHGNGNDNGKAVEVQSPQATAETVVTETIQTTVKTTIVREEITNFSRTTVTNFNHSNGNENSMNQVPSNDVSHSLQELFDVIPQCKNNKYIDWKQVYDRWTVMNVKEGQFKRLRKKFDNNNYQPQRKKLKPNFVVESTSSCQIIPTESSNLHVTATSSSTADQGIPQISSTVTPSLPVSTVTQDLGVLKKNKQTILNFAASVDTPSTGIDISSELEDSFELVEKTVTRFTSSNYVTTSLSLPPQVMPLLEEIEKIPIVYPPKTGTKFSIEENYIFEYILAREKNRIHKNAGNAKEPKIDWEKFTKRWNYWIRVSKIITNCSDNGLNSTTLYNRTKETLQQKKSDMAKFVKKKT